jgi:hypothetical protein
VEVGKFGGKLVVTTAAAGTIVATGGTAAPLIIGGVVYAGGKCVKKSAQACDNEFFENVGDLVEDIGIGAFTGGVIGGGSSSVASRVANSAYNNGIRTAGTNGAAVLLRT